MGFSCVHTKSGHEMPYCIVWQSFICSFDKTTVKWTKDLFIFLFPIIDVRIADTLLVHCIALSPAAAPPCVCWHLSHTKRRWTVHRPSTQNRTAAKVRTNERNARNDTNSVFSFFLSCSEHRASWRKWDDCGKKTEKMAFSDDSAVITFQTTNKESAQPCKKVPHRQIECKTCMEVQLQQ